MIPHWKWCNLWMSSEGCNKDVAVVLISMHSCSLDAKIRSNLGMCIFHYSVLLIPKWNCLKQVEIYFNLFWLQSLKLLRSQLKSRSLQKGDASFSYLFVSSQILLLHKLSFKILCSFCAERKQLQLSQRQRELRLRRNQRKARTLTGPNAQQLPFSSSCNDFFYWCIWVYLCGIRCR